MLFPLWNSQGFCVLPPRVRQMTEHPITNACGGNMRGILLWLIGIPIPIIILLYLFGFMH
jgi:hypothetical protein